MPIICLTIQLKIENQEKEEVKDVPGIDVPVTEEQAAAQIEEKVMLDVQEEEQMIIDEVVCAELVKDELEIDVRVKNVQEKEDAQETDAPVTDVQEIDAEAKDLEAIAGVQKVDKLVVVHEEVLIRK